MAAKKRPKQITAAQRKEFIAVSRENSKVEQDLKLNILEKAGLEVDGIMDGKTNDDKPSGPDRRNMRLRKIQKSREADKAKAEMAAKKVREERKKKLLEKQKSK